jgi:hypothetical protein
LAVSKRLLIEAALTDKTSNTTDKLKGAYEKQ